MKNTIKTLALTTAIIGVATVIKRAKKQSYSAVNENSITTIVADGSVATVTHQTADSIRSQRLVNSKKAQKTKVYIGDVNSYPEWVKRYLIKNESR